MAIGTLTATYYEIYLGGYPKEFLDGVCRPVLQIPTLSQTLLSDQYKVLSSLVVA